MMELAHNTAVAPVLPQPILPVVNYRKSVVNGLNKSNQAIYEHMSIQHFKKCAVGSGLADCIDLRLIDDLIEKADAILDFGAGYGRAIEYFHFRNINARLYGIERVKKFADYLRKRFRSHCSVINSDVFEATLPEKLDLITCLWSSIAEFSYQEQVRLIGQFRRWLKPGGVLVIEQTVVGKVPQHFYTTDECHYYHRNGNDLLAYCAPYPEQLDHWCFDVGFKTRNTIVYETNNIPRTLYLYS